VRCNSPSCKICTNSNSLHWYLAIICNVDKIKRIQADDDVQDDSQDLDQGPASLHTSDTPANFNNDADVAGPSSTVAETLVSDNAVYTKDDEGDNVNLFEEPKEINLIDRNAEANDQHKQPIDERDEPAEQTLDHESGMAAASSAAAERTSSTLASGKAMPASKKKTNHKPPSRDPDKPVIMILDSLGLAHSPATRALRQWLEAEGLDKRSMRVEIDNRGHYPKSTQIPMQDNYSDCGLYVLGYLRKFFINPDGFSKKLLLSQMSAGSDWPDMNPSKMRDDIRNLIFELNDARDGARKEAHKAKKTGSGKEVSTFPAKTDSKEVSPTLRLPDATKARPASAAPTPPAAIEPASTPTAGPSTDPPRLGSPFRPESRPANVVSLTTQAAYRDDTAQGSSTIQDFPSVSAESPIQPKRSPAKRTKSPEVRIPVKSPHIDRSTYEPYDGASDRSKQPARQLADMTSPLHDRDVRSKGDGNLRLPPVKEAQASSPSRPSRELLAASSPLQARRRSGSHDDPIPVDDSQDLDLAVRKQSQSARKPPRSAKETPHEIIELDRSQESVQAPVRPLKPRMQSSSVGQRQAHQQDFNRDDSILEVDGLEWAEGRDISRALELSLQDPDESTGRQANSWPEDLGSPMEDVFDAQAAYSQSPYTVQEVPKTQETDPMEVDNDDRVIPESPAQRRSSPHLDVMLVD
jgi:sentrin-specific protease 7